MANENSIHNSNTGNVGVGVINPISLLSVGSNSSFQIDTGGNIKKINNVPYSFPALQGTSRQILSNNGSGVLSWADNVISIINSSNFQSVTIQPDSYVNVQGNIVLNALFDELNKSSLFVSGGRFEGSNLHTIKFGENAVISGVTFTSIKIDAPNDIQFIECKFDNVTQLPPDCKLTGCSMTNSTLSTAKIIAFMNNCIVVNSSLPRIKRVSNSLISSSFLGNATFDVELMSNNTINETMVNVTGNFTGNNCDGTKITIKAGLQPTTVSGNNFVTNALSNFLDVDLTTGSAAGINISNNNFRGNTSFPNSSHIHIYGNYTGTRCITKISNNIAIGGASRFILWEYTGSADLIVNDNDLRSAGIVGVSQAGFIYERNNIVH